MQGQGGSSLGDKTDTFCRIKLLPQAEAVLNLYHQSTEEALLPDISYRIHLKALQLRAGVSIPLAAHMARHTFGTLTLEAGVSIESIAKMMGHASIASTQIYAQITDSKISRDMDRLIESYAR